jgi:hypothetical protein
MRRDLARSAELIAEEFDRAAARVASHVVALVEIETMSDAGIDDQLRRTAKRLGAIDQGVTLGDRDDRVGVAMQRQQRRQPLDLIAQRAGNATVEHDDGANAWIERRRTDGQKAAIRQAQQSDFARALSLC